MIKFTDAWRLLPPDPEGLNDERAEAAERALLSFAMDFGETDEHRELGRLAEQNVADLLADLAHYCDRQKIHLKQCLDQANHHYAEETDRQGKQFDDNVQLPS